MSNHPEPATRPVLLLAGAAHVKLPGQGALRLERKQAALLAWLSIEGATPRARLAGLLWPDTTESGARANLRQCLVRLRKAAGEVVLESDGLLRVSAQCLVEPLRPEDAALLEAERFDDLSELSAWLEGQRETRRAQHRRSLMASVRAALQKGELDQALATADTLLATDRESEEAYRTLMEVLYLRADHAAAIAVWDRCREMLRTLYGVAPSPATRHLGELVMQTSALAAAPISQATRAGSLPASVLRPPLLVGRDMEMLALHRAWQAGETACIIAEAGLGKSRLLADFAARCGPHALAAARPGDAVLPYASLSRLLLAAIDRFQPLLEGDDAHAAARLLPRLATLMLGRSRSAPPPPPQTAYERTQALLGLARLLGRCVAQGCKLFALDDLQFADAQSAEALTVLAEPASNDSHGQRQQRTSLPFAFATRPAEQPVAVVALLASLAATRRLARIELAALDAAALQALLECLAIPGLDAQRLAPRMGRHVGGNPAFVLESLKLLLAQGQLDALATNAALPLPRSVREVIDRQLMLLSEPARHLAQLAAVAGIHHSLKLAAETLACSAMQLAPPLLELAQRQLFDGTHFSHDTVADAVRASLPQPVALFMHRLVAEHLERQGAEPAAAAGHWRAAAEWARGGAAYRAAAKRAEAASLPRAQSELLDMAADCYEKGDDHGALFDVLDERWGLHAAPDFTQRRVPMMLRLEELAQRNGSEEQRLRALQWRVGWHADQGLSDSVAEGSAAIDRALLLGLPALAWNFAGPVSCQLAMRGEMAPALALVRRHDEWVAAQPSRLVQAEHHSHLALVLGWSDHLVGAIHHQQQAVQAFKEAAQPLRCLPVLSNLGLMHHWRGELAQAHAVLAEAAALRDRMQGRGSALLIDLNLGAVLRDLGQYEQAVPLLEAALRDLSAGSTGQDALTNTDTFMAENHLAQTWLALGQADTALACLKSSDSAAAAHLQARRLMLRLRITRRQGGSMAALLSAARVHLGSVTVPSFRGLMLLEIARAEPAAQALATMASAFAAPMLEQRPGLQGLLALRRAERLLELGRIKEARCHLAPWLDASAQVQAYDIERSEAQAIAFAVLTQSGESLVAERLLQDARQTLRATCQRLPPLWRDAFMQRVPANKLLLGQASAITIAP